MFQTIDQGSPATKRAAKHEWELSHVVLQTVFMARDTAQLSQLLTANIYEHKHYDKLPRYRQLSLEAYFRGLCDAIAHMAGGTAMLGQERPKTVPPPRKNKPRAKVKTPSKPPQLFPTPTAVQTPLPDWARPTIVPPPTLHAPFPPAMDYHAPAE